MSDPRYEDPMSPSRGPYERAAEGTSSLIVGTIIAALLVVFVIAFGMTGGEPSRTATSPAGAANSTTGRHWRSRPCGGSRATPHLCSCSNATGSRFGSAARRARSRLRCGVR